MAYHVTLQAYEGPLDLLLQLIQQANIDIRDIFVSEIIDQYLDYVRAMDADSMERASEFVVLAAHLLEIKSRRLLPSADPEEKKEAEADEAALIAQLEQLKIMKEISLVLREREEETLNTYTRLPDESYSEERFQSEDMTIDDLRKAFARLRDRLFARANAEEKTSYIPRDSFTVKDKLERLRKAFLRKPRLSIRELLEDFPTREEVCVTFLAILETVRDGKVRVRQGDDESILILEKAGEDEKNG